jgi:hypothetical protein
MRRVCEVEVKIHRFFTEVVVSLILPLGKELLISARYFPEYDHRNIVGAVEKNTDSSAFQPVA